MSQIDLGTSSGFALATSGAVSSAFSLFGYDPSEWDLAEGSYNGVVFHVFSRKTLVPWEGAVSRISDTGGRRKARFVFPYEDGQLLDDLGRTPETFTFEILLFGANYLDGLKALMWQLQFPQPGLLIHPVRGEIRCAMESYEMVHATESRNAVALRLTMIESNIGDISYGRTKNVSNYQAAFASAASCINGITRIVNSIQQAAAFYVGLTSMASQLTELYKAAFIDALGAINTVFSTGSTSDLSNMLPTNGNDISVFRESLSPNDPFANVDFNSLSKETVRALAVQSLENILDNLRQEVNVLMKTLATLQENSLSILPQLAYYLGRTPQGVLIYGDQTTIASEVVTRANSTPGQMAHIPDSDGALVFAAEIKTLRDSVLAIQKAYDLGVQANRTKIVNFTCPREMSVREVAYELGVDFAKLGEIDALNPELDSLNCIDKGTVVVVPV